MKTKAKFPETIELTEGSITVSATIYETPTKGRTSFTLVYYAADGQRKRETALPASLTANCANQPRSKGRGFFISQKLLRMSVNLPRFLFSTIHKCRNRLSRFRLVL